MKALFNSALIDQPLTLTFNDRALQFGDGIFETILVAKDHTPQYVDEHLERMREGADLLQLKWPDYLNTEYVYKSVAHLSQQNEIDQQGRAKLMLWRKADNQNGYSSRSQASNLLIQLNPYRFVAPRALKADFATSIKVHWSTLSGIKTLNGLPYILASRERDQRKLDELILCNSDGYVAECVSSNIFWIKDGIYYTPSLSTGCLRGVTRTVLIRNLQDRGIAVKEVKAYPNELLTADHIFTCNSLAKHHITALNGQHFSPITYIP